MCLVTDQKLPKLANRNIPIFKIVRITEKGIFNFYEGILDFEYKLNTLYETEIKQSNYKPKDPVMFWDWNARNQYGFGDEATLEEVSKKGFIVIGPGFHSFLNKVFIEPWHSHYAIGYIPKKSEYYMDSIGLIVSNQIVLTKLFKV